jgi:hypothetical protein
LSFFRLWRLFLPPFFVPAFQRDILLIFSGLRAVFAGLGLFSFSFGLFWGFLFRFFLCFLFFFPRFFRLVLGCFRVYFWFSVLFFVCFFMFFCGCFWLFFRPAKSAEMPIVKWVALYFLLITLFFFRLVLVYFCLRISNVYLSGSMPTIVNGTQTASASLPNLPAGTTPADAEATIHSHPTAVQQVGNQIYPQSASTPSGTDRGTFSQYNRNIIVGPLGTIKSATTNPNGTLNIPNRPNGAVIYDRNTTPQVELTRKAIQNILKN